MKLRAIQPRHLLGLTLMAMAWLVLDCWHAPTWLRGGALGVMVLVWVGVAVAFRSEDWGDPGEADL